MVKQMVKAIVYNVIVISALIVLIPKAEKAFTKVINEVEDKIADSKQ